MSAIRKSLLQLMFSGSYMRRWNDKLRPVELYEIDKQAHKMIVAWMLTLLNSGGYSASDQLKLQQEVIERGLFDYLYRLVTTDIKPPVFYRICENEKDYKELTEWVLKELRPVLGAPDEGFWERLSAYHRNRIGRASRIAFSRRPTTTLRGGSTTSSSRSIRLTRKISPLPNPSPSVSMV